MNDTTAEFCHNRAVKLVGIPFIDNLSIGEKGGGMGGGGGWGERGATSTILWLSHSTVD